MTNGELVEPQHVQETVYIEYRQPQDMLNILL